MSDAEASQTRLFNRTTQPRVIQWGAGVIMPGESILTDHPESFSPDQPGSPWTVDEATAARLRSASPGVANLLRPASDGPSGPQDAPQGVNQASPDLAVSPAPPASETVVVEPDGEIRNQAGEVVGYVNRAADQAANPQE